MSSQVENTSSVFYKCSLDYPACHDDLGVLYYLTLKNQELGVSLCKPDLLYPLF